MKSKAWKVYGVEGHRQRMSFGNSVHWDWSKGENTRIFEAINCDITGTNDYSIVRITRNTEEECETEFWAQISDGYFENARVGKVEEIAEPDNCNGCPWNDEDHGCMNGDDPCPLYINNGWVL